ncbi:MAG TPA: hypothetical protein VFA89_06660 [Terriglobales bacterium]|nr:hypothetical protein [Terriglobales bacterium]
MLKRSNLVCLVILLFGGLTAFAQNGKKGVVSINGGRTSIFVNTPSQIEAPADDADAGLVVIYSNLGSGSNVYNAIVGSGVLGPDVPNQLFPEWMAYAFSPIADHTVYSIKVGATYVSGFNKLVMSLNEDGGGIPGKILQTWTFGNLPEFGTCCTLQTGRALNGIPVTHGHTYWVTLRTVPAGKDTWEVWNDNFSGIQGPTANNIGSGWINEGIQTLGAFGVLGK